MSRSSLLGHEEVERIVNTADVAELRCHRNSSGATVSTAQYINQHGKCVGRLVLLAETGVAVYGLDDSLPRTSQPTEGSTLTVTRKTVLPHSLAKQVVGRSHSHCGQEPHCCGAQVQLCSSFAFV